MMHDWRTLAAAIRKRQRKAVTEDTVEGYLVEQVHERGGQCPKLLFLPGWPDRLVLLHGGWIAFVETKRPIGGRPEPLQPRVQAMLRKLGFRVQVINTKDRVRTLMAEYDANER